ncbi:MAG: DUF4097 family beta strand repeat protein [Phycisphaeraceae bacterium]|nr:DUF4097 family beta strand repeat protein [Phycisphaeraceae bacterium]
MKTHAMIPSHAGSLNADRSTHSRRAPRSLPRTPRIYGLVSGAMLLALLSMPACSMTGSTHRATRTVTRTADHEPGTGLVVTTRNGGIEVIRDEAAVSITIQARLTAGGESPDHAESRLDEIDFRVERAADRALVITAMLPTPPVSNDSIHFVITHPDPVRADLTTTNGAIATTGLAGRLTAETSNGRVTVRDHEGDARVSTSNGAIEIRGLDGHLRARTSNGAVDARDVRGAVDAETSNGAITVALTRDGSGPVDLATSNGGITLHAGGGFTGHVDMRTSNGTVTVKDPSGRLTAQTLSRRAGTVVVGEGDTRSSLRSSNGSIVVTLAPDEG